MASAYEHSVNLAQQQLLLMLVVVLLLQLAEEQVVFYTHPIHLWAAMALVTAPLPRSTHDTSTPAIVMQETMAQAPSHRGRIFTPAAGTERIARTSNGSKGVLGSGPAHLDGAPGTCGRRESPGGRPRRRLVRRRRGWQGGFDTRRRRPRAVPRAVPRPWRGRAP